MHPLRDSRSLLLAQRYVFWIVNKNTSLFRVLQTNSVPSIIRAHPITLFLENSSIILTFVKEPPATYRKRNNDYKNAIFFENFTACSLLGLAGVSAPSSNIRILQIYSRQMIGKPLNTFRRRLENAS